MIYPKIKPTYNWVKSPIDNRAKDTHLFLKVAGSNDSTGTIATNNPYLHHTTLASRARYDQIYFSSSNPGSVEELLDHSDAMKWDYLIINYQGGFGQYDHLRAGFRSNKSRLIPLSLTNQRDVFCIIPCQVDPLWPLNIDFENGIVLENYYVTLKEKGDVGIYLFWKTKRQLLSSYKVSLRIRNKAGEEIFQTDTIPQTWTYPTTDWKLNKPIIDFYEIKLDSACVDCEVLIVVYDEATLAPVIGRTQDGESVGPLINLFNLPK